MSLLVTKDCNKSLNVILLNHLKFAFILLIIISYVLCFLLLYCHFFILIISLNAESVDTLPPFSPIEGQKWLDQIFSQ
jgi:hypothetical protein